MAVTDEIADLLAPPPVVCEPVAIVVPPDLATLDPRPLGSYDNVQWIGEQQLVLHDWPLVDAPPLAFAPSPLPDPPLSNPGAAAVTGAGPGAAALIAATFSADVAASGPGAAIITAKTDEG